MTSTPQPGDINKLEDNDLFLVNKDIDGDQSKYETMAVRYKDMLGPVTGPIGPDGEVGATGATGQQGPAGTDIKIKGVFALYDDLVDYRNNNPIETFAEGDIYIVGDDYSAANSQSPVPGTPFCTDPSNPTSASCQNNIAYVFSIKAASGSYFGQVGDDVFVRIGALTGKTGATGMVGPYYDTVTSAEEDLADPTLDKGVFVTFKDTRVLTQEEIDAGAVNLADSRLDHNIKGATGPFYDSVVKYGKLVLKTNPSFDGSKDDTLDSNPPAEITYTESDDFADIQNQALNLEWTDTNKDYNPSQRYYNTQDLEFNSSINSDPNSILSPQLIKDIVGATGPNAGQPGPKGDAGNDGDIGATGAFYDSIEGVIDDPSVTPNPGSGGTTFSLKFHASSNSDPNGVLENPLHLKQDLMGPAVDENTIIDIINNIDLDYPANDDDLDGPFVHKGYKCGSGDNVNENIYGRKTFRDRLAFNPCDGSDARLIDFPANMSLYTKSNVKTGSDTLDFIKIFDRNRSGNKNVVAVGIRQGSSAAAVGIKVERPQSALEVKGVVHANDFRAISTSYYDTGNSYSKYAYCDYGTGALIFNGTDTFKLRSASGTGKFYFQNNVEMTARLTLLGDSGFFKINSRTLANNSSSANQHLVYNSGNGVVSRKNGTRVAAFVVDPSENTIMGDYVQADTALNVVKNLQPRLITDDGVTHIGFDRRDIPMGLRDHIDSNIDGVPDEPSLNSLVSLLVLSIKKLEERIEALES